MDSGGVMTPPYGEREESWLPLKRESEAQSAVVNDSPVDCQRRRPDSPQRAGCEAELGRVVLMVGQPLSQLR